MIVVTVELHSANTGRITRLGRMLVANDATSPNPSRGSYSVKVAHKLQETIRETWEKPQRTGHIDDHARHSQSVWTLIKKALQATGY